MLEQVEAVLFDLDGTLVDSMWMWGKVDEEFFENEGMKMPSDFQRQIEGMGFTEVCVFMKEKYKFNLTPQEIGDRLNQMASYKYQHEIKTKEGAVEFVKELKKRGIKTGICSSQSRFLITSCVESNGILQYIDTIKTACEVAQGKPAPDIYIAAAKELNVDPSKCLVFEDLPNGIKAGKSAGMRVCAVFDLFSQPNEAEIRKLANYYIKSFNQVLDDTYETLQ